jgi:hypothetical protein
VKLVLAEGGEGFALAIGENVSDETLVQGMGYLLQSSLQNEFMAGVYQFSIGDMVQALTKRGIYRTGKEAGEHIGKLLADSGKKLHPSMIAQYARMSERIPAEKRNPKVMPTAYLELANIPLAKKGEKETDAEFKTRVAELNKEKDELLDKLAAGEITDRKDVTEKVKTIKENAGLIKKADTSFSLSDSLKEFFFLKTTKEHFMDIHEEGVARFKEGDKVFDLTEAEVTERLDNVESQLRNYYFTKKGKNPITFKDIVEGKREVVNKGGQIDAKGKKSDKIDVVEIYPEPFWNTEEEKPSEDSSEPAKEEVKEEAAATA